MTIVKIIFGLFCVGYGIYSFSFRRNHPEKFGKLEALKQAYGDKVGNAVHIVFYSIVPILLGVFLLVTSILQLLNTMP